MANLTDEEQPLHTQALCWNNANHLLAALNAAQSGTWSWDLDSGAISWSSMDDLAFEPLYRDVFNTCWWLVLSAHFESEHDALSAADQIGSYA